MPAPKRKLVTFLLFLYTLAGFCIVLSIAATQDALRSTGVESALFLLAALTVAVFAVVSGWFAVLATRHWKDLPGEEELRRGDGELTSMQHRPVSEPDTRLVRIARVSSWSALAVVVGLNAAEALGLMSGGWWYGMRLVAGIVFLGAFTFRAWLWTRQRRARTQDNTS